MLLLKVSEEHDDFNELIGKDITFASDVITIGGQILHSKGEKAFISDVEYTSGYWSRACPDIYVHPKVSTFKINGIKAHCWKPETFLEYR